VRYVTYSSTHFHSGLSLSLEFLQLVALGMNPSSDSYDVETKLICIIII